MNNTTNVAKWIKRIITMMLVVIIITLLAPAIYMIFAYVTGKNTTISVHQDANSISVLLSMVGIAVTAWVGLNIYNVFNKNELVELIEEAKSSMDLVSQKNYVSKLRNSFTDHAGVYFAERIESAEVLPKKLIEELIVFQDLYNNQREQYINISSTSENWTIIQLGKRIEKDIAEHKYELNNSTKMLLLGYLYFCLGLLEYSPVQYSEGVSQEKILNCIKDVVNYEKKALNKLFSLDSPVNANAISSYSPNERKVISLICNCIGSIYLVAFDNDDGKLIYSDEEKEESVLYMESAIKFSNDFVPYIREVIYRNLGSAYMMQEEYEKALEVLKYAYKLYKNNPKISVDFGFCYLKKIENEFTGFVSENKKKELSINTDAVKDIDQDTKDILIDYLENALYWYELHFNCGFMEDYHIVKILADALLGLTDNRLYEMIGKNTDRVNKCLAFIDS